MSLPDRQRRTAVLLRAQRSRGQESALTHPVPPVSNRIAIARAYQTEDDVQKTRDVVRPHICKSGFILAGGEECGIEADSNVICCFAVDSGSYFDCFSPSGGVPAPI